MKYFVFVFMFAYLLTQSIKDIKTMQVYTALNNFAVFLLSVLYLFDVIRYGVSPGTLIENAFVLLAIAVSGIAGWYGKGDCKGMVSIYLALRYASPVYPRTDLALFLLTLLIADILQICMNAVQKKFHIGMSKTDKNGKIRTAYFPSMCAGYVMVTLVGIL